MESFRTPSVTIRLLWAAVAGLAFGQAYLVSGVFAWGGAVALGLAFLHPLPASARSVGARMALGAVAFGGIGLSCWGFAHYGWGTYAATVAYLALIGTLFGALVAVATPADTRPTPLVIALAWVGAEWLQGVPPFGVPLFLGGTQVHLPWREALGTLGALGTSGLVIGFGAALAAALVPAPALPRRPALGVAAPWLAGLGAAWLLGAWQPGLTAAGPPLDVAVVQGGVPNWLYASTPGSATGDLLLEDRYARPTREALRDGADLVVLPETALKRATLIRGGRSLVDLFAPARGTPGEVLVGTYRVEPDGAGSQRLFNSALLLRGADGHSVLGVTDKHRLVPITESSRYAPGDVGGPMTTEVLSVGALICWESLDPVLARRRAEGADLLAILTNDAGFEESPLALAHARQGWSRALELGRPVVRAAQSGISLVADAHGALLVATALFEPAVARATVQPGSGWTWASVAGPWLGPAALLALAALAWTSRRRRRELEAV